MLYAVSDLFCLFQLFQARPVISNWLQCMSEIRDDTIQKCRTEIQISPVESRHEPIDPSQFPSIDRNPQRHRIITKIDEEADGSESDFQGFKPCYNSTPTIVCNKTRKVLRPPERLVNEVTTWILEGEPKDSWCSHDESWSNPMTSSLGCFREAKRIRRVLTELQIDTAMDDAILYNVLRNGEVCFCCRVSKFSLFHRSYINCEVCERKICSLCITRVTLNELGMTSHDSTFGSQDSGMGSRDFESPSRKQIDKENGNIFRQIRKVFKPKISTGEKFFSMCKDCRDFIQRYF